MARNYDLGKAWIISTIWILAFCCTQEEMRRILELEQQKKRKREQKTLDPFRTEDIEGSSEIAEMQIMTWLNLNIKEPRDFRQTQLYIYGPPRWERVRLFGI